MLQDMMTGRTINKIPYESEYRRWLSRMTPEEIAAIHEALNSLIDGDRIHTAGWMPGSNWDGTPYQPIYEKAANRDYTLSAKCFGLMVYDTFMRRPENWTSGRFENHGEPIPSRTYFRVK